MGANSMVLTCFLATFVLISDNNRLIRADNQGLDRNRHRFARAVQDTYTTKYDNIDVDNILRSKRLLLTYVNCLLEKGPCSPEGRELKKYLPDALATQCKKCSEVQRKIAGKVFSHLLQFHKPQWDLLIAKYDPDGNYMKMQEPTNEDYSDLDDAK